MQAFPHTNCFPPTAPTHTLPDTTFYISCTWSSHILRRLYWKVLQATWRVLITVFAKVWKYVFDINSSALFPFRNWFRFAFLLYIQFPLATIHLKYDSEVACLVSCLLWHFFVDIFFSVVGIKIFKTLVFTVLVSAWVSVRGSALFKTEVDWRTDGPEDLWLPNEILWVPADRESAEFCTWGVQVLRYPNFFLGNGSR